MSSSRITGWWRSTGRNPAAGDSCLPAVKRTGDSQTDTINRAIQVYAYLTDITETGGTLYVRDDGSDELERLRII